MHQLPNRIYPSPAPSAVDVDLQTVRSVLQSAGCGDDAVTQRFVATRKEFTINLDEHGAFSARQVQFGADCWQLSAKVRTLPLYSPLRFCVQTGMRELGKPVPDDPVLKLDTLHFVNAHQSLSLENPSAPLRTEVRNRRLRDDSLLVVPWSIRGGVERSDAERMLRTFCREILRDREYWVGDCEDGLALKVIDPCEHFNIRQMTKAPQPLLDIWRYETLHDSELMPTGRLVEMFALIYEDIHQKHDRRAKY